MDAFISYIVENHDDINTAIKQHVVLSASAVSIGLIISLLICIVSTLIKLNIDRLINFFSFLRLIPGVALLVIALPILGVGFIPSVCSLTLITIPSILINTYSGIKNIPATTMESAISLGLTSRQILYRIQLPMALPFIILGIRTAVVDALTIATIASLMGAGGLGRYVLTGLSINNFSMVIIGSSLITLMALFTEVFLGLIQKRIQYKYTGR